MGSYLEFAQLQLHHVLIGGLNEDGGEQLGVGLHLKRNTFCFTTKNKSYK